MTVASDPMPSLPSNIAEKPRPSVPSRTSSLKYCRPSWMDGKGNFNSGISSANARTPAETPASSWGTIRSTLTGRNFIAEDGNSLEFLKGPPSVSLPRSYLTRSTSHSVKTNRRSTSCSATMRNTTRGEKVKRWAGLTRTASDWDGLRRDPELWFSDGDCLVHLYARGQSRRGPSFCVPFSVLRESKCGAMFSLCFAQMTPAQCPTNSQPLGRVSSGFSTQLAVSSPNICELYIPAPREATREDSFQWHITTRNFFAFVFGKPLVGNHMGKALVDLQQRMQLFRSGRINNHQDFLDYAKHQGYRDFVECADYALAMLYYAEHYQLRDVWIDAFVHCVGMNDCLSLSSEFQLVSRVTKALITRAYLEMDIHLSRVAIALGNFLEDDMSPAFLGLSDGARAHMDRFRSFLHTFYVEKFGYWPPPNGTSFSKVLYKSMYFDFKNMYDYLADLESSDNISSQKPASGGICVLQNVLAFNQRHDFVPLPHPLPLVPEHVAPNRKTQSQKTLRTLTLGSKQAKTDRYMTTRAALTSATNTRDISVTSCALVQAYMRFERQCALNQREEKVSMADARKVRWLLIYSTLQYLVSAIRAPKEVRDTEEPTYPLCCLVTEKSPWQIGTKALNSPTIPSVNVPEAIDNYLPESKCEVPNELTRGTPKASTIQPDCQNEDYFTHTNPDSTPIISRLVSVEVPAPLRISSPITQNSSIRSFKHLSLSALSSRRNSVVLKTPSQPFCEIIVHGYGNGLNDTIIDPPSQRISRSEAVICSKHSSGPIIPNGAEPETSWLRPSTPDHAKHLGRPGNLVLDTGSALGQARTPILDSFEFDNLVSPVNTDKPHQSPSSSNSATSMHSAMWSDGDSSSTSSKSSADAGRSDSKLGTTEDNSHPSGFALVDNTPSSSAQTSPKRNSATTPNRRSEFCFSFNSPSSESSFVLAQSSDLPVPLSVDSNIGIAISAPPPIPTYILPPPPPATTPNFDILPTLDEKPRPLPRSFSMESLAFPPSSTSKARKENSMDIFAALSLAPAQSKNETPAGRSASETCRDIEAAVPPPISKKAQQVHSTKVVDDQERGRKKERRKSLGLMLRRR
ncbi:uncharacterized protein BDR25DRAFT_305616 [Lindgomyces ingoldianus]|uniref:Uncharacterized protein n=1 Tax=Lindgomyces ingoldianus TaxID=673940 RepID=A0ACB6QJN2_9PLEO|nr:uncharacterized protein BDR25DRAFT_305616 [Lindgomyces ingoldianus]KAF2467154.1 hypothetical protein BDR25DRAFT_305616 [Lindgomyces ingoldianus]